MRYCSECGKKMPESSSDTFEGYGVCVECRLCDDPIVLSDDDDGDWTPSVHLEAARLRRARPDGRKDGGW